MYHSNVDMVISYYQTRRDQLLVPVKCDRSLVEKCVRTTFITWNKCGGKTHITLTQLRKLAQTLGHKSGIPEDDINRSLMHKGVVGKEY